MRIFRYLWLLSFLLSGGLVSFNSLPANAQQLAPATITTFEVTTIDGKVVKDAPLMTGGTYKVNFTIEVAAGLKEDCVLKTSLERASGMDRFWTLKGSYPGINSESWQPGQPVLTFKAVAGTAQLELVGSVPGDFVSQTLADGQILNVVKKIPVIELSLGSGTVVSDRQIEVINNSIEKYRSSLSVKELLLANTEADPAYSNLVKAIIADAQAEAKIGYTDLAIETLNKIPNSGWIQPQARSSTIYQWIIAAILAVIAAIFLFMLIRTRGELSWLKRQSDNQAKNLKILAKKASRIGDPSLSAGIEQMQKDLEHSIGGS